MASLARSSVWLVLVAASSAACQRQDQAAGGAAATSATGAAQSGVAADLAVAANCPPAKPPVITPSPEQQLATRRLSAEKDLATFCGRLANDAVAGKPLPTGVAKIDDENGLDLDKPPYRKSLEEAANRARLCRAVESDSCDAVPAAMRDKCDEVRDFYRAARSAPADKSFRFTEWQAAHFRTVTGKPELVDAYAKAVRTHNAASCPKELAFCSAMATLDAKKCAGSDREGCARDVARYALVEKGGLQQLAASGTPDEQMRARAALGQPNACDATLDQLRRTCGDLAQVTPSLRVQHASTEPARPAPPK
ncbi:MAG: hypothetical protein JWM53_3451 [bacterium]|nr:hypothetical protein [bacterium]